MSRGGAKKMPVCAIIPRLFLNDNTEFSIVEAYKSTRTNLEYALAAVEGCKKIIFTSAMPSEGKKPRLASTRLSRFALAGAKNRAY
ncbi:MAG: hypothetical protein L6V93_23030 [Clostridiales bacterium]|nr:MAG: hypothetical protein L6V93_23030 [Clostridiales bacterium]